MGFAIGGAIAAAGALGGAMISANANSSSASKQAAALAEASRVQQDALREQRAAQDQGYSRANELTREGMARREGAASDLASKYRELGEDRYVSIRQVRDQQAADLLAGEGGAAAIEDAGYAGALAENSTAGVGAINAGADAGIGALTTGRSRAVESLSPILAATAETYTPGFRLGLTPNQTIAREDLLRRARSVVAASGLRGAGRAGVGTILDSDRRFMAQAADTNDALNRDAEKTNLGLRATLNQRQDAARSAIAGAYTGEGQGIASIEGSRGTQLAGLATQRGNLTVARGAANAGRVSKMGQIRAAGTAGSLEADEALFTGLEKSQTTLASGANSQADDLNRLASGAIQQGNAAGQVAANSGQVQASGLTGSAAVQGNATTANAALSADVIGRIAALGGNTLEKYLTANSPSAGGGSGSVESYSSGGV